MHLWWWGMEVVVETDLGAVAETDISTETEVGVEAEPEEGCGDGASPTAGRSPVSSARRCSPVLSVKVGRGSERTGSSIIAADGEHPAPRAARSSSSCSSSRFVRAFSSRFVRSSPSSRFVSRPERRPADVVSRASRLHREIANLKQELSALALERRSSLLSSLSLSTSSCTSSGRHGSTEPRALRLPRPLRLLGDEWLSETLRVFQGQATQVTVRC